MDASYGKQMDKEFIKDCSHGLVVLRGHAPLCCHSGGFVQPFKPPPSHCDRDALAPPPLFCFFSFVNKNCRRILTSNPRC